MIEALETRIAPATFIVSSPLDDHSGGTLREAIEAANLTPAADTIVFDRIIFPAGGGKTITIDPGQNAIPITTPLTIKGPGVDALTVSAAGSNRAFFIDDQNAAKLSPVAISNLAIVGGANGTNGGGIVCFEPLSLTGVVIAGCSAKLSGGGLWVGTAGKVSITDCKFIGNLAGADSGANLFYGGGGLAVSAEGGVSLRKTVIVGNVVNGARGVGGGAEIFSPGAKGNVMITESIFSANLGPNRGGGLYLQGTKSAITNTKFAGNAAGDTGGGLAHFGGALTISGGTFSDNLAGDGAGAFFIGALPGKVSVAKTLFADNTASNPAGLAAPGGGAILVNAEALTISGSQFLDNHSAARGGALAYGGTGGAALTITTSLFSGNEAEDGGAIYLPTLGATLTLKGDSFVANHATRTQGSGGAILLEGGVLVTSGGNFTANEAATGGAIMNLGGTLNVNGTLFDHNHSRTSGGAIYFVGNSAGTIKTAHFLANSAGIGGGAVLLDTNGTVNLLTSLFRGNTAQLDGGAIQLSGGGATNLVGDSFFDNATRDLVGGHGGAIFIANGTAVLTKLKVMGNVAAKGGGIFNVVPGTQLTSSVITSNFAPLGTNTSGL